MVPVLMAVPPIISSFSINATRFPNFAAWIAARCPAGPDPITMRSHFSMFFGGSIPPFGARLPRCGPRSSQADVHRILPRRGQPRHREPACRLTNSPASPASLSSTAITAPRARIIQHVRIDSHTNLRLNSPRRNSSRPDGFTAIEFPRKTRHTFSSLATTSTLGAPPMTFPELAPYTDVALLLVRLMVALVFLTSGLSHLKNPA